MTPAGLEGPHGVRPVRALLCAAFALAVFLLPTGLGDPAQAALTVVAAVGSLWITEALPLGISALFVPVLAIALGAADAKQAFAGFGDPILFMFLGTFLLTDAVTQHGLDRRLADSVTASAWVRRRPTRLLWAIAFLGCAISAWVNNTATAAMLLPLALTAERFGSRRFLVSVLLITSYAPSLGGLATPVGTAPNLIGLRTLEQATGTRIDFAQWTLAFAPLAVVATAGAAWWLARRAGDVPSDPGGPTGSAAPAESATPPAGSVRRVWTLAEKTLVCVLAAVVLMWMVPGILDGMRPAADPVTKLRAWPWLDVWRARLPEHTVPLVGGMLLFFLPAAAGPADPNRSRIADGSVLSRIDWSTLLLFGGGLSLGAIMEKTGLARAIGEGAFHVLPVHSEFGIALAAALVAVLVSEMTSNTASATLVVPVVIELARAAGVDPVVPAIAATIGCSFGFMLPVSTPPNGIVYGTGKIAMRDMVRCGLLLDLAGAVLVAAWVTAVL